MELKHWADFLPYAPKIKRNSVSNELLELSVSTLPMAISNGYKLILRPMAHLTKEIEHNGEKFVPIEKLKLEFNYRDNSIESNLRFNPETVSFIYDGGYTFENIRGATCPETYFMIQKLRELHFDVDGLIEKGEAIAKD